MPWEKPFVRTSLRSVQSQGRLEPRWLAMSDRSSERESNGNKGVAEFLFSRIRKQ